MACKRKTYSFLEGLERFLGPPNIEKDNLTAIFPLHFLEAIDL